MPTGEMFLGRIPAPIPDGDLHYDILFEEAMFVVAGLGHPLARRRRRISLPELTDELWARPQPDTTTGALVADMFNAVGLRIPETGVTCTSIQMYSALLATGRYVAVFPGSLLHFGAKRLPIKILQVDTPIRLAPVGIVTLKNRTPSPIAKLFIDCAHAVSKPLAKGPRTTV